MNHDVAIEVSDLSHRYGSRVALDRVGFTVRVGEIFAFLGPNGGGKTTLFRVLSTLMPAQTGNLLVLGHELRRELFDVRHRMGVVFQSASLDRKLTVDENISQQAALYGISGTLLKERREEVLKQLGLEERRADRVETLSGGLKRRADLAKSLIHHPQILILDEPTTGLDPGARSDFWRYLRQLRDETQMTIVFTSHQLEEADRADRIAILHQGRIVVSGEPGELRSSLGGNSLTLESDDPQSLAQQLASRFNYQVSVVGQEVRVEAPIDPMCITQLIGAFPNQIKMLKLGKPTLEDLFIQKTGHQFWHEVEEPPQNRKPRR